MTHDPTTHHDRAEHLRELATACIEQADELRAAGLEHEAMAYVCQAQVYVEQAASRAAETGERVDG